MYAMGPTIPCPIGSKRLGHPVPQCMLSMPQCQAWSVGKPLQLLDPSELVLLLPLPRLCSPLSTVTSAAVTTTEAVATAASTTAKIGRRQIMPKDVFAIP